MESMQVRTVHDEVREFGARLKKTAVLSGTRVCQIRVGCHPDAVGTVSPLLREDFPSAVIVGEPSSDGRTRFGFVLAGEW